MAVWRDLRADWRADLGLTVSPRPFTPPGTVEGNGTLTAVCESLMEFEGLAESPLNPSLDRDPSGLTRAHMHKSLIALASAAGIGITAMVAPAPANADCVGCAVGAGQQTPQFLIGDQ